MPYFEVKTSLVLEKEKKEALYSELGRIIELIPGKSASWVMTVLEENAGIHFAGDSEQPAAMVLFRSLGDMEKTHYELLTAEICASISKLLGIGLDRIYVMYESITYWGWNGKNF